MTQPVPGVLVVDDERFFREAIRDALGAAGIECETASSGEEALERAADPRTGVVILDVRLPDMSGVEVLKRLRVERPALRVIMLSAHADQEVVLEALRLEACDYLAKPLHDEEVVLAVRRAAASYGVEASWDALRHRLRTLEGRLADLAARAREEAERAELVGMGAAEAVAEVLGATKTSLMLLDESGSTLRVVAAAGRKLAPSEMDAVATGEGVAGVALSLGQTLVVDDVERDRRFAGRTPSGRYESRALAVAPVMAGDRRLGVLCVTDREGGAPFDDDDLSLLRILARQVGELLVAPLPAAAEGAGEVEREERPAAPPEAQGTGADDAELARLVCEALTEEAEPERMIDAVLRPIARGLPAAPVSLYLIDPRSGELALEGQVADDGADRSALSTSRGLTGMVLQTGRLVASDHPEADPRFDPQIDTPEGGAAGPLLCVPVRLRGKVLGVLRAFPLDEVRASARTGEVLASVASAAVRNLLLYRSLVESIDDVAEARREARQRTAGQ